MEEIYALRADIATLAPISQVRVHRVRSTRTLVASLKLIVRLVLLDSTAQEQQA
jgi:hypothetical protein